MSGYQHLNQESYPVQMRVKKLRQRLFGVLVELDMDEKKAKDFTEEMVRRLGEEPYNFVRIFKSKVRK